MDRPSMRAKRKIVLLLVFAVAVLLFLFGKVVYIAVFQGEKLQEMAYEQQTRDRLIKAKRGDILDRNGVGISVTETVSAVSVIPAQIEDAEQTAAFLAEKLELSYEEVLEKIQQKVALVRIASKVEQEVASQIRQAALPGVAVDEDVKRLYPFGEMAAQVIGFVGADNQGILGLEAKYDTQLAGEVGKILTQTDSRGRKVADGEERVAPTDGQDLVTSLDVVIQQYAEQLLANVVEEKGAKKGIIIVMNPQNGEIYAMANEPSFDLNEPFTIQDEELASQWDSFTQEEKNTYLNQMWRNTAINDTYEPGSIFKIITSAAGLEEGVITTESSFFCSGSHLVGDRRIKCWRYPRGHGSETFLQGVQNSCNPVFMMVAERLGADVFHEYLLKFGFDEKTGVDVAGEATGIFYDAEQMGPVELATMSFGQSLQITPLQMLRAAAAAVNGGYLITPHFGIGLQDSEGNMTEVFSYEKGEKILSDETSQLMREILESVVSEGTGSKAYIPGYRIGGKTATSEKLPRGNGKYIASFLSFAPAEDPQVMAMVWIDEPQGVYYGGTVAGPVMQDLMENILPYLGITPSYSAEEAQMEEVQKVTVPDVVGMQVDQAKAALWQAGLQAVIRTEGETVCEQTPPAGEMTAKNAKVLLDLSS